MMECLHCGRLFPEVVGAPTQVCPHCGHEMESDAPARAKVAAPPVDPVGALGLAGQVARREYPFLLLLFAPAFALEVATGFLIERYVASIGLPDDPSLLTTGEQMQLLGVALPLLIALYTVRFATWTFVAARVLDHAVGGARLSRWRTLVGPSLLAGLVLTLTFAAGALLLVVGFLVFLHWFVYAPAQLAAGADGVGSAFDRSRRFARDHRTFGFTALLVLVGLAVLVPYFLADALGGSLAIVVPALINWAGGPLVPLLAASYVALAMRGAPRGAGQGHARSQAQEQGARATTTCPQCGRLIPYTPTGSPVDVVCPGCGRSGRVL